MSRLLSFSLILVLTTAFVFAEGDEAKKEIDKGLYTIVAPGTIRPNSKYTISVNLHKSDEPCEFKVGVIGPSLSELKTVKLQPFSSEEIKYEFGSLESGDYNLTAEGVCGAEFKNSTKLNFESQKYIILLQTDKATYKPDDLVRFRVLILDKNTKPVKLEGPVSIVIDDPAQNRIKQIDNAEFTKGVYSGELQLSPFPLLGKWSISVTADGENAQKEFDVDKYVLPKFEVSIDVPKYVAAKDGKVNAIVRAKYTYGKSVKGDAVVTIKPKWGFYQMEPENVISKTVPIDGKGSVSFDINDDLKFGESWENTYAITAVVTEKLTGVKLNATADVIVHRQRYRIETVKVPPYFNYEVPFDVTVVVKNYDGTPVQDSTNPVVITLAESGGGYYRPYPIPFLRQDGSTDKPDTKEDEEGKFQPIKEGKTLDENGMATVSFTIPKNEKKENKYFQLNAKYLDVESFVGSVSLEEKKNVDDSFKIEVQPEKPTLEDEITVTVSTGKGLDYFFYQVIGRGNILKSDYVKVPEGQTSYDFKIKPNFCMVPSVSIYVYYIKDGEIVHDEKRVEMEEQLQNIMKITAPIQTQPGKEVDIKVTTKPNSLVGLMGVDQSVLLLKSGNDLSSDDVFSKMRNFKTDTPWDATPGYHPRYPGRDSGVITFTNAKLPEFQIPILPPGVFFDSPQLAIPLYDAVEGSEGGLGGIMPEVAVRKEFPETWLWEKIENISGKIVTVRRKPLPLPLSVNRVTVFQGLEIKPAISYASAPVFEKTQVLSEPVKVRKEFVETWIWEVVANDNRLQKIILKIKLVLE